jgi:hypothetical protein
MAENTHKRFRVDLRAEDAEYFEQLAKDSGVKPATILKLVLADAAKKQVSLRPDK